MKVTNMFKIGDKVRVIGNPGPGNVRYYDQYINDGAVYEIIEQEAVGVVWFRLNNQAGEDGWWISAAGLILVEEKGQNVNNGYKIGDWIVYVDEGNPAKECMTKGWAYKIVDFFDKEADGDGVYVINDIGGRQSLFYKRIKKWEPQVGDVVRLKKWEGRGENKRGPIFVAQMEEFVGQESPIEFIQFNSICVEGNQWNWHIQLGIEPVNVAGRPLEAPVQGFNAKLRGKAMEAKKNAQKPVKQAKPENKLAEHRAKLQAKATSDMTAAYAICFSDGTALIAENTACHAGLNVWRRERGKCVAVYDHISKFYENNIVDEMKPSFKKFFTFLVQRSPIAHAFITKNFEDALKNGVSMDVSKTGDEIAIGCCSLRFAHEHVGRIDVWDWAIKNGFNMLTAYFLMNVAWKNKGKFNLDVRNWHNIVDGEKSFQGLIEGMANGWHDKVNKPYAEKQSYQVSKLVHNSGKNGGDSLSVGIKKLAAYTKGNDGWNGVPAYWNEKQFLEVGKKIAKLLKEAKKKPAVNVDQQQAIIV